MNMLSRAILAHFVAIVTGACLLSASAEETAAPVPADKITGVEAALAGSRNESSAARKRLAVKRVVRDAGQLFKAYPAAPNRFEVLAVLYLAQQELVASDNSPENREAFLATCKLLAAAPDEYAGLRFDAELLLTQSEMVRKGADTAARAKALMPLVKRYRGTDVEAKAIKVAIVMALELGETRLVNDLQQIIAERLAGDLEMIGFQREKLGGQVIGAPFCGVFETSGGKIMRFPMDGLGKTTVLCFWSKEGDGMKNLEALAKSSKEHQANTFGRILIVSCNVDNLPDAGESVLRGMGVDWPALRLPGGRENPHYRAFASKDRTLVTLSPSGYAALIMSGSLRNNSARKDELNGVPDYTRLFTVELEREWAKAGYASRLISHFTGEFLVLDPEGPLDPAMPPELKALGAAGSRLIGSDSTVPEETHRAIQDCFVSPPQRYRTPNAELKANYEKAEALCAKAIEQHPQATDLWIVRNRRITALMGLWKLSSDAAYHERAAAEAKLVLESKPPAGTEVVARFCIARDTLRKADAQPKQVIADFLTSFGGERAPGTALAAAALLALEVGDRALHEEYRKTILERHPEEPAMWSTVSFLLDRDHRYWLYQVPFAAGWSYEKREEYFIALGDPEDCKRSFNGDFKTPSGGTFSIPKDTAGKWTVVVFTTKQQPGYEHSVKSIMGQMRSLKPLVQGRTQGDVKVIAAIFDDEVPPEAAGFNEAALGCPVVMVPGGLNNLLVQELGIMGEQDSPNLLVLRPDGSIAASLSGLALHRRHGGEIVKNIIGWQEEKAVTEALARGDIEEAKRLAFLMAPTEEPVPANPKEGSVKPEPHSNYQLRSRAKVYMALKDYKLALADIEEVVSRQVAIDGGMSLRSKELDDAEKLRDEILEMRGKP
jgi:tetratricopeptide (TPR) repeat protein